MFLDGLHTFAQTYRDLINAFKVCPDGVILIDDTRPPSYLASLPDRHIYETVRTWLGQEQPLSREMLHGLDHNVYVDDDDSALSASSLKSSLERQLH